MVVSLKVCVGVVVVVVALKRCSDDGGSNFKKW